MQQRFLMGLALAGALVFSATAQELPKSQFKVIGLNGPTPASIHDEVPFWRTLESFLGGTDSEHACGLVWTRDPALGYARPLLDPLVAGVDEFLEVLISKHFFRHAVPDGLNNGSTSHR